MILRQIPQRTPKLEKLFQGDGKDLFSFWQRWRLGLAVLAAEGLREKDHASTSRLGDVVAFCVRGGKDKETE